ncbi:MAG: hypothetical protein Q3966_03005 [Neisseria sp.]|nr:hypothetical protein [Neisseria sp.]
MSGKIIILLLTLAAVAAQALFIRSFGHDGGAGLKAFWEAAGIQAPAFSLWLMRNIKNPAWWLLPCICVSAGVWAALKDRLGAAIAAMIISIAFVLLLYGTVYILPSS